MKHILLILLGIFAFCFFGCQSPNESKYTPPNEPIYSQPREFGNKQQYDTARYAYFFPASFGNALRNLPLDHYYEPNQLPDSTFILLSSEEEVHELLGETYSVSLSEDHQAWVQDDEFENVIKKYDYRFFENNQLLTFFVTAAGGGYYFELNNITYQNEILTVELNHISSGPGHGALVIWFAIVEIEKIPMETQVDIIVSAR